jgi:hypothetical protein
MLPRFLGTLVLAAALIFDAIGGANAGTDNGKGNNGQNNGNGNGTHSVPEQDPTGLAAVLCCWPTVFRCSTSDAARKSSGGRPMGAGRVNWNCASGLS